MVSEFSGPQKGLTIIGKHCYAYSGDITVTGANTTMLEFTTGKKYSIVQFEPHGTFSQIGQSQIMIEFTLNGNSIIHTYWDASLDSSMFDMPSNILIPPLSSVKIELSQATGSDKTMQMTLVGKVYD